MYKATAEIRDCAQVPASLLHVLEDLGRRLSRIESTLSENAKREEMQDDVFQFGEGMVSRRKFAYISKRNRFIRLSPRELTLLEIFAEHPNEVLARDMLLSRLWGIDYYGNTRTLDQHIGHIREKLGVDGARIVTVPRVGYAYNDGMSSALRA